MAQGILVFIEEREGKIKKTSLEALSAARKLADNLQESVTALRMAAGNLRSIWLNMAPTKSFRHNMNC